MTAGQKLDSAIASTQNAASEVKQEVGQTVDEAAWWFVAMERACQSQLLIEATGRTPVRIDPDHARATAAQVGSHLAGWFSFQPLWDRITADEPDLLS